MSLFPYAVALLEFGAAVVYAYNGEWRLAAIWLCYTVAAALLAGVPTGA